MNTMLAIVIFSVTFLVIFFALIRRDKTRYNIASDREVELLVLSTDVKELKHFAKHRAGVLSEGSFRKILNRINELENDKILYDDMLANQIDSIEREKNV